MNTNAPLATIAPAYACDTKWNPKLQWQIRCSSAAFNGTLFETREEAEKQISLLRRCSCGEVVQIASPHWLACSIAAYDAKYGPLKSKI